MRVLGKRRRDSGDQPAAADRHDDDVHVGHVLGDLQADRSLSRSDERVVEGMDERPACLLLELSQPVEHGLRSRRFEVDLGAVAPSGGDLGRTRRRPHHEQRVETFEPGAVRQRLRMVACGDADHASRALLRRQRAQLVQDAARLERARALEELGLEEHAGPERRRAEDGRAVKRVADRLARRADVVDADHVSLYSGPEPPSGGVSRPPLAVIAPH